jgi:hypothetical protein
MKQRSALVAVTALCLLIALAGSAAANVVEVTTWLPVEEARDADRLRAALRAAVDEAMANAVAFTPTLVAVTSAHVVGERLYVRLLLADAEGQRMLEDLETGDPSTEKVRT